MKLPEEKIINLIISRMEQIEELIRPLEKEYKELAFYLQHWEEEKEEEQMLCVECGEDKPIEEFPMSNGYRKHKCKKCVMDMQKLYNQNDGKDKRLARKAMEDIKKARKTASDFGDMTIEEITVEAAKHGLSYGKFVAQKGLEKK